ncbi:MAG TPA: SDR family NAD(P)-dependent oxidoreductase [Actinoplanes sp.]|jgi:daunorubicin C-13 ketoreductase
MTRTIVITGGSSGIGLAAAEQLAAAGDDIVLVGRDPGRLEAAVARVRAAGQGREPGRFRADFDRLADVRALAEHLLATYPNIDALANNAGGIVMDYRRTPDGLESTIESNHLAPFLLTNLLRTRLHGARVVNTSSDAHRRAVPDPHDFTGDAKAYRGFPAYGAAKSANILFTAEAARRWPDILSVCFHPGVVRTNFGDRGPLRFFYRYAPFLVTPEKAGALLAWLLTAPAADLADGAYYVGHQVVPPHGRAGDADLAAELWRASEAAVGIVE